MIGNLLSYLPAWSYWVIAAIMLALTIPYWSTIWLGLPKWAKGAILAIAGLFTAWQMGRRQQRIADEQKQKDANAKAVQKRQDIKRDISKLPDNEVDQKLKNSGWMRED